MAKQKAGSWQEALESEAAGDNEPIAVPIVDRDGDPYSDGEGGQAVIHVLGEYATVVKAYDRKNTTRTLRAGWRTPDAEEVQRRAAERLAVATQGWKLAIGGEAVPFTRENAATLYMRARWIADQVSGAMRAHVDFFGESSDD